MKYDRSNHSMIKCKFKKVNNWTTTTYDPMGAFDSTTNGVTMHAHSCMTQLTSMTSWYELTHNTPKHFQTCHKIVPYKTVDIEQNSYFMIDKYPKFYNTYIIQNKYEYYDEKTKLKKTRVNKTNPENLQMTLETQSLDTDMQRPFLFNVATVVLFPYLIGEESDGGHRINRALYIGIKRLCLFLTCFLNIIKWPMPLGARPRSIKNVNKIL